MTGDETIRIIGAMIRLARFDRGFAGAFGPDLTSCARSFKAWLYVAPAVGIYLWIDWLADLQKPGADPGLILAVAVISLLIQILGFPILLRPLCRAYGRLERWPWLITGYNWFSAAQVMMTLGLIGVAQDLGPAGRWLMTLSQLYLLLLEAFLAETMLGIGGMQALAVVLLDLGFSYGVETVGRGIVAGDFSA